MVTQRKHRAYDNDYPSVTQVLSELRKPGLELWYRYNTPQFITKAMTDGKQAGTDTHAAIEHYILTGELKVETSYVEEVTNALKGFVRFRQDHPEIKLVLSEIQMTSGVEKFNGTMDCVGEIDGEPVIFDWKTGNAKDKEKPDIYDEYITQVSAYRYLYADHTKPQVFCRSAVIVSLAKDKIAYNMRRIEDEELLDEYMYIFLPALKICHYKKNKSKKGKI